MIQMYKSCMLNFSESKFTLTKSIFTLFKASRGYIQFQVKLHTSQTLHTL
jgi:hypothetical protein